MYRIAPLFSKKIFTLALSMLSMNALLQAQNEKAKPEDTEFYTPVPKIVTPGKTDAGAPSDALVLFDGRDLDQWRAESDSTKPAGWKVADGIVTVDKKSGGIITRQTFTDDQLHIEYRIPKNITGSGQARGNSGIFLAALDNNGGDVGYELQVLDNYTNTTYVNGQAGSIYKQSVPLANPCRKPGEWQVYDVIYNAPVFSENGRVLSPAVITVLHNGILIQNRTQIWGPMEFKGLPVYQSHGKASLRLQDHGNPVSYRNIWVREL